MTRNVLLHQPGIVPYRDASRWQQETAAAVSTGAPEALAILQHPPVYTLGRRGRIENLLVDLQTLAERGAEVVETDRGGDVTFHGPGQLVAYPVLNLRARGIAPADYVRLLEETMLLTVQRFGITADRHPGRPGIWASPVSVDPLSPLGRGSGKGATHRPKSAQTSEELEPRAKLGAVGVRVQNGVSMHGLALNVDVDLAWFDAIVPCGLTDITVTSLQRLLTDTPGTAVVEEAIIEAFEHVFACRLRNAPTESFSASLACSRGSGGPAPAPGDRGVSPRNPILIGGVGAEQCVSDVQQMWQPQMCVDPACTGVLNGR